MNLANKIFISFYSQIQVKHEGNQPETMMHLSKAVQLQDETPKSSMDSKALLQQANSQISSHSMAQAITSRSSPLLQALLSHAKISHSPSV